MSTTGKNTLSIRKQDVAEQKSIAIGFKKTQFAHKAAGGESTIDLTSLTIPTEMSSLGFTNPSTNDILTAQLFLYRKNFTLWSSSKGLLAQDLSYTINSSSTINLQGFTADPEEIFIGTIDHNPKTTLQVVDAAPLVVTGTLAATTTDFNVGTPFEVNKYDSAQVGAVTVFLDGVQQFRNTNNQSSPADGNYYEVDPGGGAGIIIRFNNADPINARSVLVLSTGLLVEKPTASMMAEIERVQGQIDAMVPDLAQVAGTLETAYQAAPNNVDLKQFGDRVLTLEALLSKQVPIIEPTQAFVPTGSWTTNTTYNGYWCRVGDRLFMIIDINLTGAPTAATLTVNLPPGLTIDTSKAVPYAEMGTIIIVAGGVTQNGGTIDIDTATPTRLRPNTYNKLAVTNLVPGTFQNGDVIRITTFGIPIVDWDATKALQDF